MAALTEARSPRLADDGHTLVAEPANLNPVKAWAVLGGLFVAIQIYGFGWWILSGKATRTSPGPDSMPTAMSFIIRVAEIGSPIALLVFLYFFLYRQWRRAGRITTDGLFCFAALGMIWQDPLLNYVQTWCVYNSSFVNFGNWTTNIPGALSPTANLNPEPVFFTFPVYVWLIFGAAVMGSNVMRLAHRTWPHVGKAGLVGICLTFFVVFDTLLELAFMRLGLYTYPGAIKGLTIFHGHYYQFPIYEAPLWGGLWTAWASIRYFRNDKGQTLAERGSENLRVTGARKTIVRGLAITGLLNVAFVIIYNVPMALFAAHASPTPDDILKRSYFIDGICGPGTEYACPGADVPIPRPNSVHLGPDGRLVVPAGATLPGSGH